MKGIAVFILGFLIVARFPLRAADEVPPQDESAAISELVKQLGDDDFAAREAAVRGLEEAGAASVVALVDAAVHGDAEVKQRALSVLKRLGSASEEATVAALNGVVESGAAASAEIAKSILKLVTDTRSGEIPADEWKIPGVEIELVGDSIRFRMAGGGAIQMGNKGGGGFSRMNVKTGDGVSLIVGSSGGRQTVIAVGPGGDIKMRVTGDEDGKPVTRAYQYRSDDDFKEKNPELFEFYELFSGSRPK